MKKKSRIQYLSGSTILIIFISACVSSGAGGDIDLRAVVKTKDAQLAVLNTRIADNNQTIQIQDDALSYLLTQIPSALDWLTTTPTPFSLGSGINPTTWVEMEYPPDTRTGIPEIDIVIDAFLLFYLDERIDLVGFTTSPCTNADGLGGPPNCNPDEAEGTQVDSFPVSAAEAFHVRPEDIAGAFEFTVRGLYAVYQVPEDAFQAPYWPTGDYGIVFTSEDPPAPHTVVVLVSDGKIVRLDFDPYWPPLENLLEVSTDFILPPMNWVPTPFPLCTPPACAEGEDYYCPGECPGGCGTTCATPSP
jgi:hypothetical protein